MTTSTLRYGAAGLAGAVCGITAGVAVGLIPAPSRQREGPIPETVEGALSGRPTKDRLRPLPDLGLVRDPEVAKPETAAPTASEAPNPPVSSNGTAVEVERTPEEKHRDHEKRVSEHFADGRDVPWAQATEASFRADFTSSALGLDKIVSLTNLDCRMTSCVATISWKDDETARRTWKSLIHAMYSTPCATRIALPPQEATVGSGPVDARLLLDCTDARAR